MIYPILPGHVEFYPYRSMAEVCGSPGLKSHDGAEFHWTLALILRFRSIILHLCVLKIPIRQPPVVGELGAKPSGRNLTNTPK